MGGKLSGWGNERGIMSQGGCPGEMSYARCSYAERIQEVETAFESSEFHQLVHEATDDSLNRALDLFNVPGAVDVSLRGRPPSNSTDEEVRWVAVLENLRYKVKNLHSRTSARTLLSRTMTICSSLISLTAHTATSVTVTPRTKK